MPSTAILASCVRPASDLAGVFELGDEADNFHLCEVEQRATKILQTLRFVTGNADFGEADVTERWGAGDTQVGLFIRPVGVFDARRGAKEGGGFQQESLKGAAKLVSDVVSGRVSVQEFADSYGSFYYFEALDGHEADDADRVLFREHAHVIALHEEVQRTVVDLLYRGGEEQRAQYLAAGRIDAREAVERLKRIAERYGIT